MPAAASEAGIDPAAYARLQQAGAFVERQFGKIDRGVASAQQGFASAKQAIGAVKGAGGAKLGDIKKAISASNFMRTLKRGQRAVRRATQGIAQAAGSLYIYIIVLLLLFILHQLFIWIDEDPDIAAPHSVASCTGSIPAEEERFIRLPREELLSHEANTSALLAKTHLVKAARKVTVCSGHKSGQQFSEVLAEAISTAARPMHAISATPQHINHVDCHAAAMPRPMNTHQHRKSPCQRMILHIQRDPIDTLVSGLLYHARVPHGEPWTVCPLVGCGGQGEPSCCERCGCAGCAATCVRDAEGHCKERRRLSNMGAIARAIITGAATGELADHSLRSAWFRASGLTLPREPELRSALLRGAPSYRSFLAAGIAAWHRAVARHGNTPPRETPPELRLAMLAEMFFYVVTELPDQILLHEAGRSSACFMPICLSGFMNGTVAYRRNVEIVSRALGLEPDAAARIQASLGPHDISVNPSNHSTHSELGGALNDRLRSLAEALDSDLFGSWLARQRRTGYAAVCNR